MDRPLRCLRLPRPHPANTPSVSHHNLRRLATRFPTRPRRTIPRRCSTLVALRPRNTPSRQGLKTLRPLTATARTSKPPWRSMVARRLDKAAARPQGARRTLRQAGSRTRSSCSSRTTLAMRSLSLHRCDLLIEKLESIELIRCVAGRDDPLADRRLANRHSATGRSLHLSPSFPDRGCPSLHARCAGRSEPSLEDASPKLTVPFAFAHRHPVLAADQDCRGETNGPLAARHLPVSWAHLHHRRYV